MTMTLLCRMWVVTRGRGAVEAVALVANMIWNWGGLWARAYTCFDERKATLQLPHLTIPVMGLRECVSAVALS